MRRWHVAELRNLLGTCEFKEAAMCETANTVKTGARLIAGAVLLLSAAAPTAWAEDGKALFQKNCVACHGAAGKGDGPAAKALKPPPGDFATTLKSVGDADIAKLIKEGGKAVGKNHPAFGTKLSDEQITALVQYVKELAAK
jgi:mono/diheme cytochrome c family protein